MPSSTEKEIEAIFPSKIDSSILSAFASCYQKGFRQYILGLAPQAISPDLIAGGALAHGLEVTRRRLYGTLKSGNILTQKGVEDAILEGGWAISDYWGKNDIAPDKYGKPHIKNLINTVEALYSYFEEYPPYEDKIRPYYFAPDKPAIEFTFAIEMDVLHPTTGDPIIFCGRCDMLGYYQDFFCIIDEKTTTSLGDSWAKKWVMRGQFLGYCFAAQYHGLDISSALIRGIAFQVKEIKHMEVLVQFGQWQIDRWWKEANIKVQNMVDTWESCVAFDAYSPKGDKLEPLMLPLPLMGEKWLHSYGDACESYGGCPYRENLCVSRRPEDWLSEFDIIRWDPLAKNPSVPVIIGGLT